MKRTEAIQCVLGGESIRSSARRFGVPESTLRGWLKGVEKKKAFEICSSGRREEEPIQTLLERRLTEWKKVSKEEDRSFLIPVHLPLKGPYGIMFFGDLHLDDPGCNLPLLQKHVALCKAHYPDVIADQVGDINNCWIGKLSSLWSEQEMTGSDAWRLAQWFFNELKEQLFLVVKGNHDLWAANVNNTNPIDWIRDVNGFESQVWGARVELTTKDSDPLIINARHDFHGTSSQDPAYGPAKAAMNGWRDDILVCGHTHNSGYRMVLDPATKKVSHAFRVASYKHIDAFAQERGYLPGNIFECPMVIHDPDEEDDRYRCIFIPNPIQGVEILKTIREKRGY